MSGVEKLTAELRAQLDAITPWSLAEDIRLLLDMTAILQDEKEKLEKDIETFWKPQFDEQCQRAECAEAKLEKLEKENEALRAAEQETLRWCIAVCDHALEHYKGPVARKIRREIAVEAIRRSRSLSTSTPSGGDHG